MAAIKTELFIKANQEGVDKITKSVEELGNSLSSALKAIPTISDKTNTHLEKLGQTIGKLVSMTNDMRESLARVSTQGEKSIGVFRNMEWSVKSVVGDMTKLVQIQARWYGTRTLLDALATSFSAATTGVFKYISALDQAAAEMLRFPATGGVISKEDFQGAADAVKTIQQQLVQLPVDLQKMSGVAQAFVGAGIPTSTVAEMIPMLAQLNTAFKEIDLNQFAVAVTAAFNTFKDQIKTGTSDAEKFKGIVETLLRGQAVGIIRPEEFTKVLQYMGTIGRLSGFSVQQITAMAVAITNTGDRANKAARLAASFMVALQQPKARQMLEGIGIAIDRDKTLASQFDGIMDSLIKKTAAAKGTVPVGVQGFLGDLMGKEQGRAFSAFLTQFATYTKLRKEMEGGDISGGLARAAEIMAKPVGAQWTIFLNTVGLLTTAISKLDSETLRGFVGTLVDVARGVLFAADSTGTYADQINKLGSAGQVAYSFMGALMDILNTARSAFAPLITAIGVVLGLFAQLLQSLSENKALVTLLSSAISAGLVTYAFGGLVRILGIVIGNLGIVVAKILDVTVATTTAQAAMGSLSISVGTMATAFGVLFVGLVALNGIMQSLNSEFDRLEKRDTAAAAEHARIQTSEQAQKYLDKLDKAQSQIRKKAPTKEEFTKENEEGMVVFNRKAYEEAKEQWADYEYNRAVGLSRRRFFLEKEKKQQEEEEKLKRLKPSIPDTSVGKALSDVSSIKRDYRTKIDTVEAGERTELQILEKAHREGLIGAEEYEAERNSIIQRAYRERLALYNTEYTAIEKEYDRLIASASGKNAGERRRQLTSDKESALSALRESMKQLLEKGRQEELVSDKKAWEDKVNNAKIYLEKMRHLQEMRVEEEDREKRNQIATETTLNEYLYGEGYRSAKDYYDKIGALQEEDLERAKKEAVEKANINVESLRKLVYGYADELGNFFQGVGEKSKEGQAALAKIDEIIEKLGIDINQLDREGKLKQLQNDLKKLTDISYLWEGEGGGLKVFKRSMDQVVKDFGNWGKLINNMWTDVMSSMASSFDQIFMDFLEGKLKTLKEYFVSFLKAVYQALTQVLSKIIATGIASMFSNLAGSMMNSGSGGSGGSSGGSGGSGGSSYSSYQVTHTGAGPGESTGVYRMAPSSSLLGAKRYHVGVGPGEHAAIIRNDESVLTPGQMKQLGRINAGGPVNLQVKLENKSSQETKAEQGEMKWDGEKWVVSVVLKDLQNNGTLARTLMNRRM